MSQLISLVLADSSFEPREESENYKMNISFPKPDSNTKPSLTRLTLLSNVPPNRSDCRQMISTVTYNFS